VKYAYTIFVAVDAAHFLFSLKRKEREPVCRYLDFLTEYPFATVISSCGSPWAIKPRSDWQEWHLRFTMGKIFLPLIFLPGCFNGKDTGKKIAGKNMKDRGIKVRKIKASGLAGRNGICDLRWQKSFCH
jgi:hypothetical protein